MNKPYGITGTIASGKSTFTNYLLDNGYQVIDADKISRQITQKNGDGYKKIIEHFGREILLETEDIDRKKLSNLVFNSNKNLLLLNSITHPLIEKKILQKISELSKRDNMFFLDVPLLFETGMDKLCKKVILVYTDEDIAINRLILRDNITKEQGKKIIKNQMSSLKKKDLADIIIYNNSDINDFYKKIKDLITLLEEEN